MSFNHVYLELERMFDLLLENFEPVISADEKKEVTNFIGHSEYGLALETLCFIIKDQGLKISDTQLAQIRNLQLKMEIPSLPIDE